MNPLLSRIEIMKNITDDIRFAIENNIAINVGNEIYFINSNAMLIKKYTSKYYHYPDID